MKKRLEELKKDQKGFTLVELIVVLVILAILAALLVPALLGYIDRAKSSKYLEEARSIYTAIQAVNDEKYAKTKAPVANTIDSTDMASVNKLVTPTNLIAATVVSKNGAYDDTNKNNYVVQSLSLVFQSQDGKYVSVVMKDGEWDADGADITSTEKTASNLLAIPNTSSSNSGGSNP